MPHARNRENRGLDFGLIGCSEEDRLTVVRSLGACQHHLRVFEVCLTLADATGMDRCDP